MRKNTDRVRGPLILLLHSAFGLLLLLLIPPHPIYLFGLRVLASPYLFFTLSPSPYLPITPTAFPTDKSCNPDCFSLP